LASLLSKACRPGRCRRSIAHRRGA
jgi:hypothetical protein